MIVPDANVIWRRKCQNIDVSQLRRAPGTRGITCPYCGLDADDDEYNYEGDIEAIQKYIEWAATRDINEYLEKSSKDFNRKQPRGGPIQPRPDEI